MSIYSCLYIPTIIEPKERYKKGIEVLEENGLGNINKEGLLKNKSPKGDLRGSTAELLGVVSLSIGRGSVLLLPSSYRPYFISFHS